MTGERTRTVNTLTALLRTGDVDVDARQALSAATIPTIASWRTTSTPTTTREICRSEAIRMARRIRALDADLVANHTALNAAVTAQARPGLTNREDVASMAGDQIVDVEVSGAATVLVGAALLETMAEVGGAA
jgi:hypothetical protein